MNRNGRPSFEFVEVRRVRSEVDPLPAVQGLDLKSGRTMRGWAGVVVSCQGLEPERREGRFDRRSRLDHFDHFHLPVAEGAEQGIGTPHLHDHLALGATAAGGSMDLWGGGG